ncbi:putative protein FAR1-RELATED SEQUENCE 10 [Arachis hypogaea]|uniref:putative protein FAR1-RELATED SEQUENCE 10 n=1 Tax=Arachis hypogaea TaxID=3818 RepID=UPI003B20C2D3|nr:Protein FAR1-RELATED SEQUENCE [Arachis hypogaea]
MGVTLTLASPVWMMMYQNYGDVIGLTAEDICKKVFRSEERAYDFFAKLGKRLGFGVRKGDYGKDEEGNLIRRRFFCNKAGLRDQKHYNRVDRKRLHRPETHTNCEAKLSVYLDRVSFTWKVRKVNLEHNLPLMPRIMVHMIPGFRHMSNSAKAHINGMQRYGLPTSKILGYMAGISGKYSFLGFIKKDAYKYIEKSKCDKITDGDTNAAVIYLEGKATADLMSMARYNLTDDGMLANLF